MKYFLWMFPIMMSGIFRGFLKRHMIRLFIEYRESFEKMVKRGDPAYFPWCLRGEKLSHDSGGRI